MNLYAEAHITVEPEGDYSTFVTVMNQNDWKCSKFEHDDVDGIEGKWFASTRDDRSTELYTRMRNIVFRLRKAGYTVLRAKLEQTLFDTKLGDAL